MVKISSAKLVVDNYSTEEVIEYLEELVRANMMLATEGTNNQNNIQIGAALCNWDLVASIIKHLNEKLNGKKEKTVVQ